MNETKIILNAFPIDNYTSEPIIVNGNFTWSLQFIKNGIDANPIVTILHSNDRYIGFVPYSSKADTKELTKDATVFKNAIFETEFLKFTIDKNGATTGDMTVILMLKGDN